MTLIEVHNLSKSFSIPSVRRESVRDHVFHLFRRRQYERLRVLDDVSFTVRRGETLGIMGRNGCGKSTLLKILCGIYHPDSGRTVVRAGLTPILELGVGWNPQLNAVDNAYLMGTVMGMSIAEVRHNLDDILAFAELERFANLELRHYSSGMASRLAYSIAFKATREILIIDEIFAVGDAGFQLRCEERYRELSAAGHTVVIVSHDPKTIIKFADRALLLEAGRIQLKGSPEQVVQEYMRLLKPDEDPLAASGPVSEVPLVQHLPPRVADGREQAAPVAG